jgi:hypothetical protein
MEERAETHAESRAEENADEDAERGAKEAKKEDGQILERSIDELPPEMCARISRALFADTLADEERRIDEIFERARPMLERDHDGERILPPVFRALAADVLERRCRLIAHKLADIPPRSLTGPEVLEATRETFSLADRIGVAPTREGIAHVIENALEADLGDPSAATEQDALRSIGLLQAAEAAGVEIARTRLEENVYALLSNHRSTLAAGSAEVPEPRGGLSSDTLAQLAQLSNLSLRSFERMQSAASEENVEGVTG